MDATSTANAPSITIKDSRICPGIVPESRFISAVPESRLINAACRLHYLKKATQGTCTIECGRAKFTKHSVDELFYLTGVPSTTTVMSSTTDKQPISANAGATRRRSPQVTWVVSSTLSLLQRSS